MCSISLQFEGKKAIPEKLIAFGFAKKGSSFFYSAPIVDNLFELTVCISKKSAIETKVVDKASQDAYNLHLVCGSTGNFVGKVRSEYNSILDKMEKECFEPDVFKSGQSKLLIKYLSKKYGASLEYLWKKFPNNAIVRRTDNSKWYAAFLTVAENKLGLDGNCAVEIIDLRASFDSINKLVDGRKYFHGYHMNKKNWITLRLNNTIPISELYKRIDESYRIAGEK